MHKRRKIAYKEDQIGLMYLAMKGRKRCASCKHWTLLTVERCLNCNGTEFDLRKEAPKQKKKLLSRVKYGSPFYRNYLILRLGVLHGFRRAEIVGQDPKEVYCHCMKCRAFRLHKQGKTLEQIADAMHKGLKETEFKIDEASRYGEHKLTPLPGMRVEHFMFNAGTATIEQEIDGETVPTTVPYATLQIYGKGYEKGKIEPKEIRIFDPLRSEINDYIEANKFKPETNPAFGPEIVGTHRMFPITPRQCANIVKQAANIAGTPHAESMAPHGLRRSFATITWRKLREKAARENTTADPLTLQKMMRHASFTTTVGYIIGDEEDIQDAQLELLRRNTSPEPQNARKPAPAISLGLGLGNRRQRTHD